MKRPFQGLFSFFVFPERACNDDAMTDSLKAVREDVIACARCPRLVSWRNEAAREPPTRYAGQEYWAKPLPGFGDPNARLVVVGLAPAAHGGNRTGRIFTGDRSGDWLFRALAEGLLRLRDRAMRAPGEQAHAGRAR